MKLFPFLAAITVVLVLAARPATAQEPTATPTPGQEPPATPTPAPAPPSEVSPPPTVTPAPSPPPPPAPSPAITAAVPPGAPEPPMPTSAPGTLPSPPAATPAAAVARVADPPVVTVLRAPAENPFGLVAEVPATLPPKLAFTDATATGAAFVSARVDANGRIMGVREQRDPIPSLAALAQKSLARWLFEPARRGAESVETWAAMRLDLHVEIDTPRSVQGALIPVTPTTPIPRPLAWVPDEVWLESRKGAPPEGGVPLETVDTPPMPKKTPWDANSYKGPFSAKFWVRVTSSGVVEKAIPLEASDPILLGYLRRAMSTWTFRPAQVNGAPVNSWNELSLSGQVVYKVELKQIASLRRSLFGS